LATEAGACLVEELEHRSTTAWRRDSPADQRGTPRARPMAHPRAAHRV